jgi:tRNA(Ile)-lysidine synthase
VRGELTSLVATPLAPLPFERWLTGPRGAPLAVALSGGGDSLALLHLAKTWADRAGRPLVALTVDHGLQPPSAGWSRFAASRAERLGVAARRLTWRGDKPAVGLPAAARAARHALLADAARQAGARVVLMGHTADDLLEAEAMRAAGSTVPSPRPWSPSPAWPEGRGVFLLRPLLGLRRAALRSMLLDLGETWIDDPANDDPRFSRAAARRRLSPGPAAALPDANPIGPPSVLASVRQGRGGELTAPVEDLAGAPSAIGALALCAAGTTRPPAAAVVAALAVRFGGGYDFTASLAGARIEARGGLALFCREAGEWTRRGLAASPLPVGESVFDGRFTLTTSLKGAAVTRLRGLAARLPAAERDRLRRLPPPVRGGLPAVVSADGGISCPLLSESGATVAWPLAGTRLRATLGGVSDEAALWRVAETDLGA